MAAQMLLRYSQSPQVHAAPTENVMNIWQKPILRKALTSFCISSEIVLPLFLAQITSDATVFDLQLL